MIMHQVSSTIRGRGMGDIGDGRDITETDAPVNRAKLPELLKKP
jgi:hypothetical protein